ncbi:MAG: ribonuclease HI family protein [Candidatus Levyibacteriota bacterium]
MPNTNHLIIHGDGGSRGNPGEAAYGFVISQSGKVLYEEGKTIGINTNNVAEYSAVIEALKYVHKNKDLTYDAIHFFLDSKLVVEQMNGRWKIKNEILRNKFFTIKSLEKTLNSKITYVHIPREKNTEADRMVNLALDGLV